MQQWRLLGSACLLICRVGLANAADAPPALQEWDHSQATLRESIWQTYSLTAALGRDARGRRAADDLNEWVMTDDVIGQLQRIRAEAERDYRSGDQKAMNDVLESGEAVLQAQRARLLLVSYYWAQKVLLDRHRDLWTASLNRASDPMAARSRDRMQQLEAGLTQDYSPTLPWNTLNDRIESLRHAYNEERIKLAAAASASLAAAGGERAGRNRMTPCVEPAPAEKPAHEDKPAHADKATHGAAHSTADRPPRAASNPSPDQFYPEGARRYAITGKVSLLLTIAASGCMKRAEILRSSGAPELDDAAIDLSEQATYFAAERGGRPIESRIERGIDFELTDAERTDAEAAKTKATANGYITSGNALLNQQRFDGAIADFDKALAIDPASATALADRGLARLWKHEDKLASKDFEAAFEIEPNNPVALRGRGMLALQANDFPAAIAAFTSSLDRDPHNLFALQRRAQAYIGAGEADKALADNAELIRLQPNSANSYAARGYTYLERRDYDLALADLDKAIAIDPHSAWVFANRGFAHLGKHDSTMAQKDFDAAFEIDPRNPVVFRGRGVMALQSNDLATAVAAFTTALELQPGSLFALQRRAEAFLRAGDGERALADSAEAIRIKPSFSDMYAFRAMIYRAQGSAEQSAAEAKSLIAANPADSNAYLIAGRIYAATGRDIDAAREFDHAVQILPNETAYLARAYHRHSADLSGKRADIDAVLKLDAASKRALLMLADLQITTGAYADALATLGTVPGQENPTYDLLVRRGIVKVKIGQTGLAQSDFTAAQAKATDVHALNTICWQMATAGVALVTALAACEAGLAEDPDYYAIIDSRGFVLLRLGRLAEAIECYDSALKIRPTSASSLYGRGLAKLQQGAESAGRADIRAALALDAAIAERFDSYGLQISVAPSM
jgi:TonB family protein